MARWEITIDTDVCVGSGTCVTLAPDVFELDEEDRSCPRAKAYEPDDRLREAAALCPTRAIDLTDSETGQSPLL